MKLRNKKTGEIDEFLFEVIKDRIDLYRMVEHSETKNIWNYNSLAELNADWEDVEEPKEYWIIDWTSSERIDVFKYSGDDVDIFNKSIGNYFKSKEEAEKAVEKLKAFKRLKDKGFRFEGWWYGGSRTIHFRIDSLDKEGDCLPHFIDDTANDLDLLFGGKE